MIRKKALMRQSSKRHTNATINHMTAGTNVTKIKSTEHTYVTKNHKESLNVTINHTHSVH